MQHLLTLIIVMLVIGLSYTLIKWPGGMHMTFSQHAAATRYSKVYYSLLFLTTLPLLMWFLVAWLMPNKNLPGVFLGFAGIAVLFQILCTWFPEEGGRKTKIHRTLTGISGIAMLPLLLIIGVSASVPMAVRGVTWFGLIVMMILLGISLRNQKAYKWALLLQVGYYAIFFAVLLLVTYI